MADNAPDRSPKTLDPRVREDKRSEVIRPYPTFGVFMRRLLVWLAGALPSWSGSSPLK